MRLLLRASLALLLAFVVATPLFAQAVQNWVGGNSGDPQEFNETLNWVNPPPGWWLSRAFPGDGDWLFVNNNTGNTPIYSTTIGTTFDNLEIGVPSYDNVTTGAGSMSQISGTMNLNYEFKVGYNAPGTSTYDMSGGVFNATGGSDPWIGQEDDGLGTTVGILNVHGTAQMSLGGWMELGAGGTGYLNVTNGGQLTLNSFNGQNGHIELDGATSVLHVTNELRVSMNGNDVTMDMTGGTFINDNNLHVALFGSSVGHLNVSGGTLSVGGQLVVGQSINAGTAASTMNITGNSTVVTAKGGGFGGLMIGNGATGILTLGNGTDTPTLQFVSPCVWGDGWLRVGNGGGASGTLTVKSGIFDLRGAVGGGLTEDYDIIGASTSTGVFNQEGGQTLSNRKLNLGDGSGANATLNLDGGFLQCLGLEPYNRDGNNSVGVVANIYFNGGTLSGTQNNSDFIKQISGTYTLNVTGGAVIATPWDISLGINLPLVHAGVPATDGGLTKLGCGNLTLTAQETYTGPTTVACGQLTLTNPTVFGGSVATRAISITNCGTLNASVAGLAANNTTVSAVANLTVGGPGVPCPCCCCCLNMPVLAVTSDGTLVNTLALGPGTFSGVAGTTLAVDLVGTHDVTAIAPATPGLTSAPVTVLTYSAGGVTPPALLPRYSAIGRTEVAVAYAGSSVVETFTNSSVQGFGGATPNWFDSSNWYDPAGGQYTYTNSTSSPAWFVEVQGQSATTCVLDQNATTNSMLFYATPGGLVGFNVTQGGNNSITLSAVGSTNSAEAQIQVLGGSVNTVDPGIVLGAAAGSTSCSRIYLEAGSQLTLNGAIGQSVGGTAGLCVLGGPGGGTLIMTSTSAAQYTGCLSVDSATVSTAYLPAGHVEVTNASLTYTGTTNHTCGNGAVLAGSAVTLNISNVIVSAAAPNLITGPTTVSIPMDNPCTRFLETDLTVGGNGLLQLTSDSVQQAISLAYHTVDVEGGTLSIKSSQPTLYTIGQEGGSKYNGGSGGGSIAAGLNGGTGVVLVPDATTTLNVGGDIDMGSNGNGTFIAGNAVNGPTMYVQGSIIAGDNGTGAVTLHNTTLRLDSGGSNGVFSIGRSGGTGVVTMDGSSSLTITNWFNVGCYGAAQGSLIMHDYATLTQTGGGSQELGCYGAGAYGLLQMDGHATLTMAQGGNFEAADNRDGPGAASADIIIGGSATATFGGHFYVASAWNSGSSEAHATITLSDHGTLNVGTNNPEWTQLGYGNDAATNTFDLTMSGTSTFYNGGNHFGMVYGGCSGSLTMSDSSQLIVPSGECRIGAGGTLTANLSGAAQIIGDMVEIGLGGGSTTVTMVGTSQINTNNLVVNWTGSGPDNVLLNVGGTASVNVQNSLAVGFNWGSGPTAIAVGTVTVSSPTAHVNVYGNGTYNFNGLTPAFNSSLIIGACGGIGYWNQNAGTTYSVNPVVLGEYDWWDGPGSGASPGAGTLNLNGGEFQCPGIIVNSAGTAVVNGLTTGVVNFAGGTLTATNNNADFISIAGYAGVGTNASLTLNVLGSSATALSGAVINANGYSIAINQPLVHASATPDDGGVAKVGAGTLTLTAANTYNGATTLKGGTLVLGPNAWAAVTTPVANNARHADIQKGLMVFDYSASSDPTNGTILPELTASHASAWTSGQFQSSTAAGNGTTLGWIDNTTASPIVSGSNTFAPYSVTVMAAVPGDANLNGTVDQNDFDLVLGNFGSAGGWTQGDFNYNGVIDQNDFDLVLGNFGSSFDPAPVYHASGAGFSPVPEPGTLALLAAGLIGLLAYAWRKRK